MSNDETSADPTATAPGVAPSLATAGRPDDRQRRQRRDYVLRNVEERKVQLIRLWFTDVLGQLKSVAISPAELETALEEGVQFDGSAIDGFSRVQESDVLAVPDPASYQLIAWGDGDEMSARVFCDLVNLDGTPFEGDPRQVLRRNLSAAAQAGYSFMAAPEVEFFYFRSVTSEAGPRRHASGPTGSDQGTAVPEPLDHASYFDLTTFDASSDIRRATIQRLEATGIPIEYSFHEDAPSQHEIDLRYDDGLSIADAVMTLRLIVREVALAHGVHATFMPKPLAGVQGSGMHTHLSLWDGNGNAFHDPSAEWGLSGTARQFIAGLLVHAPEITALTNQLVNSYKRLVAGFEAPVHVAWARNNRSALIRVPVPKHGKESTSTRIEYRSIDPSCNPYLAFSVMLAAGLDGIHRGLELPPEASTNLFELTEESRRASGVELLPSNLSEALDVMEGSQLVRDAVGDHIVEWFLRNKRSEWNDYKAHVSQFELDRYLRSW